VISYSNFHSFKSSGWIAGQVQAVEYNSIKNNGEYVEANVSDLINGVYFIELVTAKQKLVKRFIKE